MKIYKSLNTNTNDSVTSNIIIKNVVDMQIPTSLTASVIDAIIDDQICTQYTTSLNVTATGSTSAYYNSIKWNLYDKSGTANIHALEGRGDESSSTASSIKIINVPRETIKNKLSVSSIDISLRNGSSTLYYVKDMPKVGSTNVGWLMLGDSPTFSVSAGKYVGEVFYDSGTFVFRGDANGVVNFTNSLTEFGFKSSTSQASTITINSLSFKREQEKVKRIYFCRAMNREFNYSGNPSFRSSDGTIYQYVLDAGTPTYVTTVGLYDDSDNLLAVAKLNPLEKKTFEDEIVFKIAITY